MKLINKILNEIMNLSVLSFFPDGSSFKTILNSKTNLIATLLKVSLFEVELIAVKNKIIPERYLRNMKTISFSDQVKLLNTHVCIVGLGGLGGMVLENLVRIGIGHFTIIDGDVFEYHNLNRQILSSTHNIGIFKTDVAIKRTNKINPAISIIAINQYLTEKNSKYLIDNCDITVDCLDNINARFILEIESKRKKIPMVSAAVAGTTGHITTIFPKDPGLKLIFGEKVDILKEKGVETTLGCLSHAVSMLASLECSEVVKVTLGQKTLRNKLLVIDTEDYIFEVLNLN